MNASLNTFTCLNRIESYPRPSWLLALHPTFVSWDSNPLLLSHLLITFSPASWSLAGGEKVFYAVRRSTPNAASLLLSSKSKHPSAIVFDSLKSLPVEACCLDSAEDLKSEANKANLDLDIVTTAAMWLRGKLHLTIFGFDVVVGKESYAPVSHKPDP
eukprot:Gb_39871 [translate_table: standard]